MSRQRVNIFRKTWKDYLAFSRRERIGLYALIGILVIQIAASYYLNFMDFTSSDRLIQTSDVEKTSWMRLVEMQNDKLESEKKFPSNSKNTKATINYFHFNPNTCGSEDFELLGLSARQVTVILKYRDRGGRFIIKSDFKKMYCISQKEYTALAPWIVLPDTLSRNEFVKKQYENRRIELMVDLSQSDSLELDKLPGIGSAFARRIVKYRTKLGGFYSVQQLKEVWGFTDSLFEVVKPHIFVSDTLPGSLMLNILSLDELGKHPYVGFKYAKVIISYREQHGSFRTIEDFKKVPLYSDENFRKLAPYINLN